MTVYLLLRSPYLCIPPDILNAVEKLPATTTRKAVLGDVLSNQGFGGEQENCCPCRLIGQALKRFITERWSDNLTIDASVFPEVLCPCALSEFVKRPQVQPILFDGPLQLSSAQESVAKHNWIMWGTPAHIDRIQRQKELCHPEISNECWVAQRECCSQGLQSLVHLCCLRVNIAEKQKDRILKRLLDLPSAAPRRPPWNNYFMRMATMIATRSNCIKRCVGAVVVLDRRIVATGYNGTPFGATNCIEGGCARCSDPEITSGHALDACTCLHAEANALLEAGRKCCIGATLYVTLHPCLSCIKLICQSGIKHVYYSESYEPTTERTGANLLKEVGITVEYMDPY